MEKIKKHRNKNAFTLVELIVVITILAILGTISYASLQGFSGEARNTKRKSDLANIKTSMEINMIEGGNIYSFVEGNGSIILGNGTDNGLIQISGRIGYNTLSGSYNAGNINYTALGINKENFVDPITEESYKIGITTYNNQYNLAATIETDGVPDTYVIGKWNPRSTNDTKNKGSSDLNIFYLSGSTVDETGLRKGDLVKISTGTGYIIIKLDNSKIYLDRALELGDVLEDGNIMLYSDETDYLISRGDSGYVIRVGTGDERYVPYKISN